MKGPRALGAPGDPAGQTQHKLQGAPWFARPQGSQGREEHTQTRIQDGGL